jgi:hypothetical protein
MTDRELLQQALDALEKHIYEYETIQAIKARLAQPDADAVAWVNPVTLQDLKDGKEGVHLVYEVEMVNSIPLFEYQPEKEWVGLTDEEIKNSMRGHNTQVEFAKAIEAKLKEKNT